MKRRLVIISIDSLLNLFKDYAGAEIPQDAKPIKLMVHPQERKFAVVAESEHFEDEKPLEIRFDIRRVFGVGG